MWSFGSSWYLWPCYYYMQKRRKICSRKIPEQVSVSWPWASHLTSLISSLGSEGVDFSDNEGPSGCKPHDWSSGLADTAPPEMVSCHFCLSWPFLFHLGSIAIQLTFLHENSVFLSTLLSDRNVILLHNWFTDTCWFLLLVSSPLAGNPERQGLCLIHLYVL